MNRSVSMRQGKVNDYERYNAIMAKFVVSALSSTESLFNHKGKGMHTTDSSYIREPQSPVLENL